MNWSKPSPEQRAWLYEITHRGNPGDLAFYVAQCAGARSVLEMGCGWGRVLEHVARECPQVVGVDLDEALLARAGARVSDAGLRDRVKLLPGDITALDLKRLFDRVLIPYNTLFALGGEAQIAKSFQVASAHLAPGGLLLFDVYVVLPGDKRLSSGRPSPWEHLSRYLDDNSRVDIWGRETELEGFEWRMDYRYAASPRRGGRDPVRAECSLHHSAVPGERLLELARRAGFELEGVWSGFGPEALVSRSGAPHPMDSPDETLVVAARWPGLRAEERD